MVGSVPVSFALRSASLPGAQSGFTYLFVLMLILLIGLGLAATGTLWRTESRRAKEAELLFVGDQYRKAIRSFYELKGEAQPRLPQTLEELLQDPRRPDIVRHLRRAWRDPVSGGEFILIRAPDTQGITGVHSPSGDPPLKLHGFSADDGAFAGSRSYSDWQFVYIPPKPATAAEQAGEPTPPPAQ
jgi:type II secretory pathway pseudopilin PulG